MNRVAIVDDEDYDLNVYKWRTKVDKKRPQLSYAIREVSDRGGTRAERLRHSEHLHRVILERKIGRKLDRLEVTDHIDGNGLNNRRSNLQAVSQSVNMFKARRGKDNTSGYKGVWWNKNKNGWDVYINKDKKRYRFGRYKDFSEAVEARRLAEKTIWQNTNFQKSLTGLTQ